MGHCGPHPHISSANLFCTITLGVAASFGGVFSSDFSILMKVVVGTSFTLGGIGHDTLATNKFVEARTVFGHGMSSLVGGAVNDSACSLGLLLCHRGIAMI